MRLKVILSDLDNEIIINWIDGELQGYKRMNVPEYRIIKGELMGTYILNYQYKYTNAPVPVEHVLDEERINQLRIITITDSITTLQNVLNHENKDYYGKIIPTALCHYISTELFQIAGMRATIASNHLDGIVSKVKSKLVEIVMELEKQFDNLDEMDIKSQIEEDHSKKKQVVLNIEQIIYDGSINVGDKNKFSKSRFGHLFGGENA
ncbi:hypothetical protein ACGTN9_17485 [Halobacillus sp. MO56]